MVVVDPVPWTFNPFLIVAKPTESILVTSAAVKVPATETISAVISWTVILGVPVNPPEVPVVFWLPAVLTPGKSILEPPLNDTPPILRAVSRVVAVAALPEVSWLPEAFTPGKLILALPSKDTPPIVRAFAKIVAEDELPDKAPEKVVAVKVLVDGLYLNPVSV